MTATTTTIRTRRHGMTAEIAKAVDAARAEGLRVADASTPAPDVTHEPVPTELERVFGIKSEDRYAAKLEAEFAAREDSELWQMLLDYGVTGEGKTLRAGISEALSTLEHRIHYLARAIERSGVDPSTIGVCRSCFGRGTQSFGFPCDACGGTGQAASGVARAR
jgi:hypothetical protein